MGDNPKPGMKRIVLIGGILGTTAVLAAIFLPSLKRAPAPEEIVPVLAKQELAFFYKDFEVFTRAYQRPPASVAELMSRGRFLRDTIRTDPKS